MSDEVRKRNAEELRKAWNKFLKEQNNKNGRDRKGKTKVKRVAENMEQRSVTYGI